MRSSFPFRTHVSIPTDSLLDQINSANELVLTELILENTFATYEPEEVVALLSCFIFQEKTDVEPLLTPTLEAVSSLSCTLYHVLISFHTQQGKATIIEIANKVQQIQTRHRADFADEGFNTELKFGLVEVVYEWAKGMVSPSHLLSTLRFSDLLSKSGAVLLANYGSDRRARRNDRSSYYPTRRDVQGSERCSQDRWERGFVQQDGTVPAQDQAGHHLLWIALALKEWERVA